LTRVVNSSRRSSSVGKQALHEIMYADTRAAAERELACFTQTYGPKYPKAAASLTVDQDRLLAYFDDLRDIRTSTSTKRSRAPLQTA
jgi:transposase-like protein